MTITNQFRAGYAAIIGNPNVGKSTLMNGLLDFKLSRLKEEIDQILRKWNYISSTEFLKHAKDGTLSEAEMDAIELINLNDERERLLDEKTSFIKT